MSPMLLRGVWETRVSSAIADLSSRNDEPFFEIDGAPHVPARYGAPGSPALGITCKFIGRGQQNFVAVLLPLAEGERKSVTDAVISNRQHIGPAQAENQQHVDGPHPDAANLRQLLDDRLVATDGDS